MIEALEDEFDVVPRWTEQVVEQLGPQYAIAAACRGSGSPDSLAWLTEALDVRDARRMLDAGSGVGGPAAWVREHTGVSPVCAEPMPGAVRAGRRLFGLPAVVASGQALPLRTGSFDVAWCLGVLDTAGDKAALLSEVRRVLEPDGRLGLLAFLAAGPLPPPLPEGNDFSTRTELDALLAGAGFRVRQSVPAAPLRDAPAEWRAHADRVEDALADRHATDPRFQAAQRQTARIARLIADGHLHPTLLHAVALG